MKLDKSQFVNEVNDVSWNSCLAKQNETGQGRNFDKVINNI